MQIQAIQTSELVSPGNQLRALAQQFLQSAAAANYVKAQDILADIFSYRGRCNSLPLLRMIASGQRKIIRDVSLYYLADSVPGAQMQIDLQDAIAACATFSALPTPAIMLEFAPELEGMHLTIEIFPGLALIKLSSRSPHFPDHLRKIIFHEVAHAYLTCGVRLLDEGFASLFAHRYAGASLYTETIHLPFRLSTLLSHSAQEGLFFEQVGGTVSSENIFHGLGARLIAALHKKLGATGLGDLFHLISQAYDAAEVSTLLERAMGKDIENFSAKSDTYQPDIGIQRQSRAAIFSAYRNQAAEQLDTTITWLETAYQKSPRTALDALVSTRIAKAVLQINTKQTVAQQDLARIDLLMAEAVNLSQARLWTIRGHRAVLALKLENENVFKAFVLNQRAAKAYDHALTLTPDDADLRIGRALLYINTPQQFGGDRARGLNDIRALICDEIYGAHACDILRQSGEFARVSMPVTGIPKTCQEASSHSQCDVAIQIAGLELRLSDSFSLNIPELSVGRHERIAIIGKNGAGKSAFTETLLSLRTADKGQIQFVSGTGGIGLSRRAIGANLQKSRLFGAMYGREILKLHLAAYGKNDGQVCDVLGIGELLNLQYKNLSRGQLQRIHLFLALAHQPAFVFLDEPSLGLDEWYAQNLRNYLARQKMTLLLISHVPADIEDMDKVIWINEGRIREQGKLSALTQKFTGQVRADIFDALTTQVKNRLSCITGLTHLSGQQNQSFTLYGDSSFSAAFQEFVQSHKIRAYSIRPASTEDFLARITRV